MDLGAKHDYNEHDYVEWKTDDMFSWRRRQQQQKQQQHITETTRRKERLDAVLERIIREEREMDRLERWGPVNLGGFI